MLNKPIDNPKINGCLNCSSVPKTILDLNRKIDFDIFGGVHNIKIILKGKEFIHYFESNKKSCTIEELISDFNEVIEACDSLMIEFSGALRGEIYEFNKVDKKLYLVEQTMGWA